MSTRYVKTEAGRQAIRDRAQAQLSRPARNLLLIIDGQRTGAEWVGLVNGSSEADLQQLIDGGLIEPAKGGAGGSTSASAPAPTPAPASVAGTTAPQPQPEPPAAGEAPAASPRASGPVNAELDALQASLNEDTRPVPERLQTVSYRHLYDTMTSQARPLLGLIKGYRMVLDVEKCNGPEEIRRLALRFINEVRGAQGVGAAYRITEQLCRPSAQ